MSTSVHADAVGWLQLDRAELLEAIGLGIEFAGARGDYLYWTPPDTEGPERRVLDLVGGFGANLLGHNHPEVREAAREYLAGERPLLVQGSRRVRSERLKQRLARLLRAELDQDYAILLFSTGAEAVEAALRHARLEFSERQAAARDRIQHQVRHLARRMRDGQLVLDEAFYRSAGRELGAPSPVTNLEELQAALWAANEPALGDRGVVVSRCGGYHGKTAGALAVTWNPLFRHGAVGSPSEVVFFGTDEESLEDIARRQRRTLYGVDPIEGRLARESFETLAAIILEPIQGEGGVIPMPPALVQQVVSYRSRHPEVPVIVDEIQTGLGRTGAWLESTARGLPVDYVTLGKALGGGVCKVSALGITRARFRPSFTHLHSSTFAEDELSSAVADRVLEIIERDRVPHRCARLGVRIGEQLERLASEFPGQIAEVRGRGLMRAIELTQQRTNPSRLIQVLADEGLLAAVLAAYLLHEHDIRVLPTLGNSRSLRIAPSAYLDGEAFEHIHAAFADVCRTLARGDAFKLLRHLVGARRSNPPQPRAMVPEPRLELVDRSIHSRVGFVCHFLSNEDLAAWDPALAWFTLEERERLLKRFSRALRPRLFARDVIGSAQGASIELVAIGIFLDAREIERDLRENRGRTARAHVHAAYDLARQLGCSVVGFGGYTSIVTGNCTEFTDDHPTVTTGNALTVAMGHEGVRRGALELGMALAPVHAAVVGATGNIGRTYARLLAAEVGRVTIIGRSGSLSRLRAVAAEIAAELVYLLRRGIRGGALLDRCAQAYDPTAADEECTGEDLLVRLEQALGEPLVELSTDLRLVRRAQVVLSVSNSASPILFPEHIAPDRPVLVCDLAVPADVSPSVAVERPLAHVIAGGIVCLPKNSQFTLPGTSTPPGAAYACLAEAILLGLSDLRRDFSRGAITTDQVREIAELARVHGFSLAPIPSCSSNAWLTRKANP